MIFTHFKPMVLIKTSRRPGFLVVVEGRLPRGNSRKPRLPRDSSLAMWMNLACPSRPSCDHTHTHAARQCIPTTTTRSSMRITRPCVPAFGFFFWFSSWCACVRFFFAFRKQVIMQDAKTYDADATEPMPTRCARSRIEARCCHCDHGRSG